MKKTAFALLLIYLHFAHATTTDAAALSPYKEQGQAAHLSAEILTRYHYKAIPLDDGTSKKIFDSYIKSLDGEKVFFLQSDIDQFSFVQNKLDDSILSEDLTIPFNIFNTYKQRIADRVNYAKSLLKPGMTFDKKETYVYNRDNEPWAKSDDEIQDIWRKRVKNDWIRLKLAGKDDKSIIDTLNKRYDQYLKSISRLKSEDVFQSFMNSYAMAIDPHTNYFGVRASEDFDISMKSSLEGIGAVLEEKDEYVTIRELVPGGPAALSGKLKSGDRIIGVAQGDKSPITDVTSWRIDDAVALIRGPSDSTVVLEVLPAEAGADGKHVMISLVRKKIALEKQNAKKSIIEVKDGNDTHRIGVISLPVFYEDFAAKAKGDPNYKSASRDVDRLLADLKKDNVEGVLIDLRNNGGGSLTEAVDLTGLFIDQGPVVQERDSKGMIQVDSDTKTGASWDKPLGVIINHSSASASEIFAAAIQDYGRGVIIGEPSFGKGTVQTVVDLDKIAKNDKPKFGELKMTIAQFFRVNGGTTQLRGVTPDIAFPIISDMTQFGESSYKNALPWTQIKAADYKPTNDIKNVLPAMAASHDSRVSKDKEYQFLVKDIADLNIERQKKTISLNLSDRQKERDSKDAKLAARKKLLESDQTGKTKGTKDDDVIKNTQLQDDGLQGNERDIKTDLAIEKARENTKDVLLNEAAHIISDQVSLLKSTAAVSTK